MARNLCGGLEDNTDMFLSESKADGKLAREYTAQYDVDKWYIEC